MAGLSSAPSFKKKKDYTTPQPKSSLTNPTPSASIPQLQSNLKTPSPVVNPTIPHYNIDTKKGTVQANIAGEQFNTTTKELSNQQKSGGAMSQAIQQSQLAQRGDIQGLIKMQQKKSLQEAFKTEGAKGRSIQDITADIISGRLIGGQAGTGGVAGVGSQGMLNQQDIASQIQSPENKIMLPEQVSDVIAPAEMAQKNIAAGIDIVTGNEAVAGKINSAAQLIGSVSNLLPEEWRFGTGKSTEVKAAEAAFIDANDVITNEIDLVKAGAADWQKIDREIQEATITIQDLKRQTKGMGRLNMRYWLTSGKEIEKQVDREISILEQSRRALMAAAQESQQKELQQQVQATYGL